MALETRFLRIVFNMSMSGSAGEIGSKTKIYTHLHVREDAMILYGFNTREELRMFELLITVSGIGPKAALSIMSSISITDFSVAVISNDPKALTKAHGVGGKTAERLILELRDKLKKENLATVGSIQISNSSSGSTITEQAISGLMVLGYTRMEAQGAVNSLNSGSLDLQGLIRDSLKILAR